MYTTRDQGFKDFSDWVINFEPRDASLVHRVLRAHGGFGKSNMPTSKENANVFEAVLDLCAGLPLALGVAGASARKQAERYDSNKTQNAWADYVNDPSSNPDLLISSSTPAYGRNVTWIVDASFRILQNIGEDQENHEENFQALFVVRKQQIVPLGMLQRLWSLENVKKTKHVVE